MPSQQKSKLQKLLLQLMSNRCPWLRARAVGRRWPGSGRAGEGFISMTAVPNKGSGSSSAVGTAPGLLARRLAGLLGYLPAPTWLSERCVDLAGW